jgi:HTH domain
MTFKNELDKLMKKAPRTITYQTLADSIGVDRTTLWRQLNNNTLSEDNKTFIKKILKSK